MAKRKIIWSVAAKDKFKKILSFYNHRNGNNHYSISLLKEVTNDLRLLINNPELGVKTSTSPIRGLIIGEYIFFYEVTDKAIVVLTVWSCQQDPNRLKL